MWWRASQIRRTRRRVSRSHEPLRRHAGSSPVSRPHRGRAVAHCLAVPRVTRLLCRHDVGTGPSAARPSRHSRRA
jgi:hypothetical protein